MSDLDHVAHSVWDEYTDHSMNDYFSGGPGYVLIAVSIYLLIVYFLPRLMKNQDAYTLSSVIKVYNLANIFLNMGIFLVGLKSTNYGLKCFQPTTEVEKSDQLIVIGGYFCLKIFDFLDTIFFILRKKDNQVTRLHVVHHAGMPCLVWLCIKFCPYPASMMTILLNSFVHMVMYAYYYLASIPEYKVYLWWKKYITVVQLVQFMIIAVQAAIVLPKLGQLAIFTGSIAYVFLLYMIYSFSMFYYKTYVKVSHKPIVNSAHKLIKKAN